MFGGGEPKAGVSSEPTAKVTPTETPSVVPEDETAEEFIRRWFEAELEMQRDGNAAAYLAISDGCSECREFADLMSGIYSAGGYVKYEGQAIKSINKTDRLAEGYFIYRATLDEKPTLYKESAGGPELRRSGGSAVFHLYVEKSAEGWQMRKYQSG